MDERIRFVLEAIDEDSVMSEVCARYGISRTAGYKWLDRYRTEGLDGLKDRPRAPLRHGRAREASVVERVLSLRERHPRWGPKKLQVKFRQSVPDEAAPAVSTIGDWLRKEGLVQGRRRRRYTPPYARPFAAVTSPNDVWCVDFKGWFRTGDGARCDPFTMSDAFSRYLLCCAAVGRPDHDHVRPLVEAAFYEHGLPAAIRSDNGPPFASVAAGGLSQLSVWLIKLGIACERIEPGQPQQNGRHERMHGTLAAETARPPAGTVAAQQAAFDRFRAVFNQDRPHEALDFETPARLYQPSARAYPCEPREPEYGDDCAVRRVRCNGEIRWGGDTIFVSEVLAGEPVGVRESETGEWCVRFADVELGYIDQRHRRLCRKPLAKPETKTCGLVDNAKPRCPQGPQKQQNKTD